MIRLRELQKKDAPLMLEWMHDPIIQKVFQKNMIEMKLDDTEEFCVKSSIPKELSDGCNLHFAIVDEQDEYLGTVSLKNIDLKNKSAEYAISTRSKAHGKGIAYEATGLILKKAFNEYKLHRVYLNVLSDNEKAIRLYERSGFSYEGEFREHIYKDGKFKTLKWYGILENDFENVY